MIKRCVKMFPEDETLEKVFLILKEHVDLDSSTLLTEENFESKVIIPFEEYYHESYAWEFGATKLIFILNHCDWVIKIPFNARQEYGDEEEEVEYYRFEYADCENGWDYCAAEVDIYEKARQVHLDNYFLQTMLYGEINGYPVYIQKKCPLFHDHSEYHDISYEESVIVRNICNDSRYHNIPYSWAFKFYSFYGELIFKMLLEFLVKNKVYDLHEGNIGYINEDEMPVIVDYGSYNE